ncbi:TonB-dependent receptor [Hirschia baltica]|uniref:TonB-dependent receptor n=1 Tax=Hirschia baltica (strain ATCC 49814 / DSM 5838 / IFAM 1418) TaxID=582402 RepID=C6XQP9_HIRBI|nr:TonB-dependent receptor [Hirschia baltica]ACT58655.1 TonB-dependent receptor [Hirschia baltica ATCC 49814]
MKKSVLFCSSAILAGLSINTAYAQSAEVSERRLEAVVVSTQKIDENLLDVPINVSAVDQDFIDLINADDLEELADFIPGLQVQAQSLNAPSFSIRGVTSDGGAPRVAIFTNGVSNARPGWGASLAYFDMERIEVVKGPQPTLFGQGALVGGINFIQNKANTDENSGYVQVDAGSYNTQRLEAAYNWAVSDTFALRLSGVHDSYDGYIENHDPSTPDLMGQKTDALRLAAHWSPTANFTADIIANYEVDDSTGTEFRSAVIPTGAEGSKSINYYDDVEMNFTNTQGRDGGLGSDREIFSITGILEYDLNEYLSLTSITDYRDQYQDEAFDSDGTSADLLQLGTNQKGQSFSQELRLNFNNGGKLRGFVGLNYFDEHDSQNLIISNDEAAIQALLIAPTFAANFGGQAGMISYLQSLNVPGAENAFNIYDPLRYSLVGLTGGQVIALNEQYVQNTYTTNDLTSTDVFADISYDVTDRLTLTGGLRYTEEEFETSSVAFVSNGNATLGGTAQAVFPGTDVILPSLISPGSFIGFSYAMFSSAPQGVTQQRSYNADGDFTWRLAANYELADDLNGWASIARGRRPGGLSADASETSGFAVVDPEFLTNYELGLKGEFLDNRLRLTSSVYYSEYEDFQVSFREEGNPVALVENTGAATQYGFEVDAFMIAHDNVDVFATYGYNFSEFDDSDSNGNSQVRAGNTFRISPKNTLSLGAELHFPMGAMELFAVPTYVWKDEVYFSDENTPEELQDAYGLLDFKVGLRNENKGWEVSAFVENATDEEYLIDYGNTGDAFGIPTTIRGIPRWYGVKLKAKF